MTIMDLTEGSTSRSVGEYPPGLEAGVDYPVTSADPEAWTDVTQDDPVPEDEVGDGSPQLDEPQGGES